MLIVSLHLFLLSLICSSHWGSSGWSLAAKGICLSLVGVVVLSLAAGALLLVLTALGLDLLVAALGKLRALVEAPLGAEARVARPRLVVDEDEGGVLGRGGEGVVRGGEVEDGVTRGSGVRARASSPRCGQACRGGRRREGDGGGALLVREIPSASGGTGVVQGGR